MPHSLDLLTEGGKPVVMGDDATQPLPEARLGIQLGRVGGLRLEHEPAPRVTDDGLDWSPLMLLAPVMDDQQVFPGIVGQQVLQAWRKLLLPQRGAAVIGGAPGQRGHSPRDMPLGMVIPRGHLRHVIDHTPLGGQRRVAPHGRFIHKEQLPLLRPVLQQRLQLSLKGRLLLGLGLQVAVAPPAQAKPQLVPQLADPLPAVLQPKAGGDEVPDPRGGP